MLVGKHLSALKFMRRLFNVSDDDDDDDFLKTFDNENLCKRFGKENLLRLSLR